MILIGDPEGCQAAAKQQSKAQDENSRLGPGTWGRVMRRPVGFGCDCSCIDTLHRSNSCRRSTSQVLSNLHSPNTDSAQLKIVGFCCYSSYFCVNFQAAVLAYSITRHPGIAKFTLRTPHEKHPNPKTGNRPGCSHEIARAHLRHKHPLPQSDANFLSSFSSLHPQQQPRTAPRSPQRPTPPHTVLGGASSKPAAPSQPAKLTKAGRNLPCLTL